MNVEQLRTYNVLWGSSVE